MDALDRYNMKSQPHGNATQCGELGRRPSERKRREIQKHKDTGKRRMSSEGRNKQRVLVADDERVIADTLAMILSQSGFETRAVYSGEQALEVAASFQPEMLISDVIMAGVNGIDAAIEIRRMLPQIKVLLFSGQAATADLLEKARARGYDFEILAKPVHPQDLLARMRG